MTSQYKIVIHARAKCRKQDEKQNTYQRTKCRIYTRAAVVKTSFVANTAITTAARYICYMCKSDFSSSDMSSIKINMCKDTDKVKHLNKIVSNTRARF